MTLHLPLPDGMTTEVFLNDYWQKKPLLIRAAFAGFESPLAADDVAGMACAEGIESRLILEQGGATPWHLRHGPFDQATFAKLPGSHWALLVQEAHKYVPELAELLEHFRFIPNWRVDDIMVNYSPAHGSVGPHVDQYDVFLLQGHGRKRWSISDIEVTESALIPNIDLRILAQFQPQETWELAPGDMLYLPPGVSHHGVALDDNLTYSIGFRAPLERDLIASFGDYLAAAKSPTKHYQDPDLLLQQHPGEISHAALEKVRGIIAGASPNEDDIARWFGQFVTESKTGEQVAAHSVALDPREFSARLSRGEALRRSEYSRFAYIDKATSVLLFIAGEVEELDHTLREVVHKLCDTRVHRAAAWRASLKQDEHMALLCRLYNAGHLDFEHDQD